MRYKIPLQKYHKSRYLDDDIVIQDGYYSTQVIYSETPLAQKMSYKLNELQMEITPEHYKQCRIIYRMPIADNYNCVMEIEVANPFKSTLSFDRGWKCKHATPSKKTYTMFYPFLEKEPDKNKYVHTFQYYSEEPCYGYVYYDSQEAQRHLPIEDDFHFDYNPTRDKLEDLRMIALPTMNKIMKSIIFPNLLCTSKEEKK